MCVAIPVSSCLKLVEKASNKIPRIQKYFSHINPAFLEIWCIILIIVTMDGLPASIRYWNGDFLTQSSPEDISDVQFNSSFDTSCIHFLIIMTLLFKRLFSFWMILTESSPDKFKDSSTSTLHASYLVFPKIHTS